MKVIDGRKIAQSIRENIAKEIKELKLSPSLHTISFGGDKTAEIFLSQKERVCREVGISFYCHRFWGATSRERISQFIRDLNANPKVSGILIQLPLSSKLGLDSSLLDKIRPDKDVDCLTALNFGKFASGTPVFVPPTAQAVNQILDRAKIKVKGKNVTIVGAGRIAGLPIALSLLQQGATVTICQEFTKDLKEHTKKAEVLISATGRPRLIKDSMIKKGAVVIDVGTSWKNGKMVGDVDFQNIGGKASLATPVPGGVGPIVVACLLKNVLKATKLHTP